MALRKKLQFLSTSFLKSIRKIQTTAVVNKFHEESRKLQYEKDIEIHPIESFKKGFKMLPEEIEKFKNELKNNILVDECYGILHKDYHILWKFDKPEIVDDWIVTSDSDHGEGILFKMLTLRLFHNKN